MDSGRGRSGAVSKSTVDAPTEEETTDAVSASSTDVASRSGDDMERLFVGECWLRLAPRRFKVGVGVRETSLSVACTEDSVVTVETTVETTVDGTSSTA